MIYVFQLGIGNLIGNTKPNSSITSTMSTIFREGVCGWADWATAHHPNFCHKIKGKKFYLNNDINRPG